MKDFHIFSDKVITFDWGYEAQLSPVRGNVSVYIAAFTTAHARLRLLDIITPLDERVLYVNTDSVLYVTSGPEQDLPLGNYLGELTNEIPPVNSVEDYIVEFASSGCKNYTYKTAVKRVPKFAGSFDLRCICTSKP